MHYYRSAVFSSSIILICPTLRGGILPYSGSELKPEEIDFTLDASSVELCKELLQVGFNEATSFDAKSPFIDEGSIRTCRFSSATYSMQNGSDGDHTAYFYDDTTSKCEPKKVKQCSASKDCCFKEQCLNTMKSPNLIGEEIPPGQNTFVGHCRDTKDVVYGMTFTSKDKPNGMSKKDCLQKKDHTFYAFDNIKAECIHTDTILSVQFAKDSEIGVLIHRFPKSSTPLS